MAALNHHLNEFAAGRVAFGDLLAIVESLTAEKPGSGPALRLVLSHARESGILDERTHARLVSTIDETDDITVTNTTDDDPEHLKTLTFSASPDSRGVATVGPGSVVKHRFELGEMLGRGGMGIVYRARDRIRVEAQDRNPYVAIKVLNEDFKAHPESFIALQRECSRTQKLAHPNIATVYDFDRTGPMAFLTMELMEGKPLNELIDHALPNDGLAFDRAWPIIDGLGQALSHAHARHVVHSDFKPGNAFVTDDGAVKVLDFGIARAFKQPGAEETTMFNAAKLGALTPRYASPEMLEGDPPDPRDDVYALGVVAYMLLAGRHPFEGKAANVARAMAIAPPPVAKLDKLQNRALQSALEFERDSRVADVETFLRGLEGESSSEERLRRQSRLLKLVTAGFVILVLCVLFLLTY